LCVIYAGFYKRRLLTATLFICKEGGFLHIIDNCVIIYQYTFMKVYLDCCSYNRPFDDQKNIIIHLETEAKLVIQQMIKDNELVLIWSDVLDYENYDNPFEERRDKISEWKFLASDKVEMNDSIYEKAKIYMLNGLKQKDAAHIACAVHANGDYFITVDKKVLNKTISDIVIIDPINFLRRLQNDDGHRS